VAERAETVSVDEIQPKTMDCSTSAGIEACEIIWFRCKCGGDIRLGFRLPDNRGYVTYAHDGKCFYEDTSMSHVDMHSVKVVGDSNLRYDSLTLADCMALYDQYDIETGQSKSYTPQVGDVVEFRGYTGLIKKGIVFKANWGFYKNCDGIVYGYGWDKLEDCREIKKIGHTNCLDGFQDDSRRTYDTTKQYFSTPTFAGTYAERQQQWIDYHGVKVGDKVKAVRKTEEYQDGSLCGAWNSGVTKANMFGETCTIRGFQDRCVEVQGDVDWFGYPYFALEPVK
jgi:hypothetical protein